MEAFSGSVSDQQPFQRFPDQGGNVSWVIEICGFKQSRQKQPSVPA